MKPLKIFIDTLMLLVAMYHMYRGAPHAVVAGSEYAVVGFLLFLAWVIIISKDCERDLIVMKNKETN